MNCYQELTHITNNTVQKSKKILVFEEKTSFFYDFFEKNEKIMNLNAFWNKMKLVSNWIMKNVSFLWKVIAEKSWWLYNYCIKQRPGKVVW